MPGTLADFLAALLSPEQVRQLDSLRQQFADPQTLLRELVRRGWLTPFQANQLAQGKGQVLLLDQYVLLDLLGQGGMGAVYQARQLRMDRLVALKTIRREALKSPKAVERFQREARLAAQLSHPNIVTVHDTNVVNDLPFLAMEFIDGIDLAKLVAQQGRLPVAVACDYIRQAALGLQHAHEHGLVHRDIKPHNLMRTPQGIVKVMDLGLARTVHAAAEASVGGGLTGTDVMMGTPDYLAPEQAKDAKRVDIRADIYSLGCTLYHLLAGQVPFPGGTLANKITAHLFEQPQALTELRPEVPAGLAALVQRMMAKKPEQRYQTPAEVAAALVPWASGGPSPPATVAIPVATLVAPPHPPSPPRQQGKRAPAVPAQTETLNYLPSGDETLPPAKGRGRRRWRLVVGVVLGAAALGLAALLTWAVTDEPQGVVGQTLRKLDPGPPATFSPPATKDLPKEEPKIEDPKKEPDPPPNPDPAKDYINSLGMKFVRVPASAFWMGGGGGKAGDRQETIARDFYVGVYPVTQEQWRTLMTDDPNPSWFSRTGGGKDKVKDISNIDLKQFPVESVSWEKVQKFIDKLNEQEKKTNSGWKYRLPTEAEWEYACRGGATSKEDCSYDFYFDKPTNDLSSNEANLDGNFPAGKAAKGPYLARPTKVGSYQPNRLSLYDMHGNVWQWCDDLYDGGSDRVIRGGSWYAGASYCRAAHRARDAPSDRNDNLGFRLVRVPSRAQPGK